MKTVRSRLLVAALALTGGWSHAAFASSPAVVGEITTVIGRATVSSQENAEARKVLRGLPVHAGDRLETEEGGHVHIRFIDGGLVSVRPLSRLRIEDYNGGAASPAGSIRFSLEHGVMRSVTGTWGEEDRNRFRLNTPVVAIGIKGTDFVVSTAAARTQAHVVTGAITMTPLADCPTGGTSCSTRDAVLLSADMRGKLLEFNPTYGVAAPKLVAAVEAPAVTTATAARSPEAHPPRKDQLAEATPIAPNVESRLGDIVIASNTPHALTVSSANTPRQETPRQEIPRQEIPIAVETPVRPVPEPAPVAVDKPMLWLNNPLGWGIAPNTIARTSINPGEGMARATADMFLSLYRDISANPAYLGGTGEVSFNLSAASASFTQPGIINQPVVISNPQMSVDFNAKSFATRLDLAGKFGSTVFQAVGSIDANGLLAVQQEVGQKLKGALSNDARQAGYLFEKDAAYGRISGLTLWGK